MEDLLQPVIDAVSEHHNISFSVAIRHEGGRAVFFSGLDDRSTDKETNVTATTRFPMGSVTKSWTAAAIMRMREQGKIDIDAPISIYVDPVLQRLNGTTMNELWCANNASSKPMDVCTALVKNMTTRLVMGMRAGLQDYIDADFAAYVRAHTGTNQYLGPFELLHLLRKKFVCAPGTCGHYASPGYELLGLVLVHLYNYSAWEDLDQLKATLPEALLPKKGAAADDNPYSGVVFSGKEPCSAIPNTVHQYSLAVTNGTQQYPDPNGTNLTVHYRDIYNSSCLNGWTCGNIVASVAGIAEYYYDLLTHKIVNASTLKVSSPCVPSLLPHSITSASPAPPLFYHLPPTSPTTTTVPLF
jgi:hypothetical protein